MPTVVRPLHQVAVATPGGRYDIHIGAGLLTEAASWQGLPRTAQALIVTDSTVGPLYAAALQAALAPGHGRVGVLTLPAGETHKNWQTLNLVFDRLLADGCDRQTVLYALGGGVVGDITGFAAASYMRGVPFVQVPTTLLAQVDSSVGGKTGINHPLGKNMIGAFHQPLRVVCDLDLLASLPARELSAGLAEVIKYGPIADADFLAWIEQHLDALLARDAGALAHAVQRCCAIKAAIVGQDERESALRAVLNFGHTFGHAIEAGLGYGQWLHGEAVGCGMVLAADLSARMDLVPPAFVTRLRSIVQRAGLPVQAPSMPIERWLQLMQGDKKAQDGQTRFVLLDGLGRASLHPAPQVLVRQVIAAHSAQVG